MTRNPYAENAALRSRLRTVEGALTVALAALRADDDPAKSWLLDHLAATLERSGEPEAPTPHPREPEAGTIPNQE